MTLSAGMQLGPYEIVAPLGAGGMGEVYRARDTKLEREVAIKVLPDTFARDPERVARFQREAKVLASLNHPNIAAIYGFETTAVPTAGGASPDRGGASPEAVGRASSAGAPLCRDKERRAGSAVHFLVLELVEGETLAERLRGGAMPVDEALDACKQIAEALEAAHERGVIHRDLKPANVKVTPEGVVKVLDFGLAKAFAGDASGAALADSPTITVEHTRPGVVLGTAAYMSPEQARGKPLDKRTDIWSFGCVLYECLTGIRPFLGETASDTIAKILERDPDWDGLSIETPPLVRALLRRCLQKDRKQRLHDIGDARIEMAEVSEAVPGLEAAERFATATRMPARTWKVAALVLAAAAVAGWLSAYRHWVSPNSVYRLSFGLPAKQGIATDMDVRLFDITDDGRAVVWLSQEEPRRIYYRSLDSHEVRAVPGTEGAENLCIALSPDGRDVLFVRGRALWRAQLEGGAAQKLLEGETATAIWDFDWAENGSILISLAYVGLARLRGPGAALERLTQCDAEQQGAHAWVRSLPGGRAAIFTVGNIESGVNNLALLMLDGSEPPIRTLLEDVWFAEYVPTGHLLFVRDGTLFAVVFDLDSLAVRGPAAPVLPNVQMDIFARIGEVAASHNGTLVYLPEQGIHDSRLAWIDREGDVEFLPLAEGSYYNPRVSPDGGRISVTHRKRGSRYPSVSLYDVRRSILQQFCKERSSVYSGVWSADGSRIAFSAGGNLYIKPADGGSPALRLGESRIPVDPLSFSPNGEVLLGAQRLPRDRFRLVAVDVVNGGSPQPITAEGVSEISGVFSPDGRWIAYVSDEEGQAEVFIRGIAGGDISLGRKERVSRNGGWHPAWAPGGDALFYLDDNASRLLAVSVLTEPRLELGDTKVVLEFSNLELELPKPDWLDAGRPYDVSADGRRFLVAARQGAGREMQVNVTLNWFEELKAKVPTGK